MKIWVVLDYVLPTNGANTLQVVKTAEALSRYNSDTTLIVPCRNNRPVPETKIFQYYGVVHPFTVRQMECAVGAIGWIRKEKWTFPKKLFKGDDAPPDIVLTRAWPTLWRATRLGVPTFYETYRHFVGIHRLTKSILHTCGRYPAFKGIISHSATSAETLKSNHFPVDVHVVHNGFDDHLVPTSSADEDWPAPGKQTILYAGHVGMHKGIESIFALASQLPRFDFVIAGFCCEREKKRLLRQKRKYAVENIHLLPWIEPSQVVRLLRRADAVLLPPTSTPYRRGNTGLPLKVFEYLASGRLIIGPNLPVMKPLLEHNLNACLVPPDNICAAARLIEETMLDRTTKHLLQQNQVVTAATVTWDNRAKRLLSIFDGLG